MIRRNSISGLCFGAISRRPFALVIVFAVALYGISAPAQTIISTASPTNPAPAKISLAQARELAFTKNWDLLAAKSGIDAAAAQLIVAKEVPNPTASLSTFYIGTGEAGTTMGNGLWKRNYDTIFAVNQLIEIAGKRRDRQTAAHEGVIGAKARFYDAKRTLDQGVTKAYIAALLAEENVRILNESSRLLQHEADIAGARFTAGDLSDSDRKQIEISAEQFALQAKAAEMTSIQAKISVEVLMGIPKPSGTFVLTDSLTNLVEAPVPDPTNSVSGEARPDVLAAEADLKSARANLKLQKAIRIPDPTVELAYQHQPVSGNGGPPADTLGVGVTFPLPIWNLNGGNIKAAQASIDQYETAAGKARMQVLADIAIGESELTEARQRWLSYRDKTAPKSANVRQSVAFAYEKGGSSLVDLLDAERTDNDVRLATVQAMADTASALADLAAARNVVSPSKLETHR